MSFNPDPFPPCAYWRVWEGPEIEGAVERQILTLFVRDVSLVELQKILGERPGRYGRIWFCREFRQYDVITWILVGHPRLTVNLEITLAEAFRPYCGLPPALFTACRLYVKLPLTSLKPGDQLMVGAAYHEQCYVAAQAPTTPGDYQKDVCIL